MPMLLSVTQIGLSQILLSSVQISPLLKAARAIFLPRTRTFIVLLNRNWLSTKTYKERKFTVTVLTLLNNVSVKRQLHSTFLIVIDNLVIRFQFIQ